MQAAYPEEIFEAVVTEFSDASTDAKGNVVYEVTVTVKGDDIGTEFLPFFSGFLIDSFLCGGILFQIGKGNIIRSYIAFGYRSLCILL